MATVLVAGSSGCRVFTRSGEQETELAGRQFSVMSPQLDGTCLAVLDAREIWRRASSGIWTMVATADINLQSLVSLDGIIFAGAMDEAVILRIPEHGSPERLTGFDRCPGREQWFAGGPPLGVRSLASTREGAVIAAVHVGGLPYSLDHGDTWTPTIPVMHDVHEVRCHPTSPNFAVAAAAVGLCVSGDGGKSWSVVSRGLTLTYSLAVTMLKDEVIFAISDGPFAKQSQLWRWRIGSERVEQIRDGLPEWLDGKVDTAQLVASSECAAAVDGGGTLWLSQTGSKGWSRLATGIAYPFGLSVLGS